MQPSTSGNRVGRPAGRPAFRERPAIDGLVLLSVKVRSVERDALRAFSSKTRKSMSELIRAWIRTLKP